MELIEKLVEDMKKDSALRTISLDTPLAILGTLEFIIQNTPNPEGLETLEVGLHKELFTKMKNGLKMDEDYLSYVRDLAGARLNMVELDLLREKRALMVGVDGQYASEIIDKVREQDSKSYLRVINSKVGKHLYNLTRNLSNIRCYVLAFNGVLAEYGVLREMSDSTGLQLVDRHFGVMDNIIDTLHRSTQEISEIGDLSAITMGHYNVTGDDAKALLDVSSTIKALDLLNVDAIDESILEYGRVVRLLLNIKSALVLTLDATTILGDDIVKAITILEGSLPASDNVDLPGE